MKKQVSEKSKDPRPEPVRRLLPTFRREYVTHATAYCDKPVMTLEFGQHCWSGEPRAAVIDVVVGVVMPIDFVKRLVRCIQSQIDAYEQRYGQIPID